MNPSKYWIELNKENQEQLDKFGYENFKRTIALNYFTWTIAGPDAPWWYLFHIHRDRQVKYLIDRLPPHIVIANIFRSFKRHKHFTWLQSVAYNFFTNLLWDYTKANDPDNLLDKIDEPLEGNPPRLYRGNKLISQDLAHSVLEYYSIMEEI